ncbi:MAG: hypothetical protein FWD18_09235 [Micrococcales bacterium]|nr:hypothetical protein [Micrococcales bacterium]
MSSYTRVTILGAGRRAEMVIPDAEPLAAVLPDVLDLLEHAPGPVVLATRTGDHLDAGLSLAAQDVADGTPLWVVPVDQAPPPAEVTDITELTAVEHTRRADTWNPTWTRVAAGTAVAVLTGMATWSLSLAVAAAVLVGLVVAGSLLGRARRAPAAVMCAAGAVGAAVTVGVALPGGRPALLVALACLGLAGATVALVGALGFADRALGAGGVVSTVLVLVVLGIVETGADLAGAAAVGAAGAVLVVGLAPGFAMTASGLAGLDDRLVTGESTPRAPARTTVDAAYRSLTWVTVAAATVAGVCGALLVTAGTWGRLLAGVVAVVLFLRMRVLPLVPQRLVLAMTGLAVTVASLAQMPAAALVACAAVLALGVLLVVSARLAPVVVARLNRLGDVVETLAVVAMLPLVLACWGVFADLVEAFA